MSLRTRLLERQADGRPITVGVVGAGQMGTGLVSVMEGMAGMQASMVVDAIPGRAVTALQTAGVAEADIRVAESAADAQAALAAGHRVVAADTGFLPGTGLEAVVEATGIPEVGARVAMASILARRHVVMLNVETDVTVGRILHRMARAAGVVYTLSDGDEPGVLQGMVDFAATLGFTVVAAGKGKNNVMDVDATPESVAAEAKEKGTSPKMLASFEDGSKTMIEMTALANATGLKPERRGMVGRHAQVGDLARLYAPRAAGGDLDVTGIVDYVIGVAPGVFVIVTSDRPHVREELKYLSLGPGPSWALYRPYHLTSLETPISVARAVLDGDPTMVPGENPVAEAIALAKRDLAPGDVIDGIGGTCVRGVIELAEVSQAERLLPVGLLEGATVLRPVPKGAALREGDVRFPERSTVLELRRLQDEVTLVHA